jgi:murein DD-endopeptidase MepM/ murein hydrolase activator NlpD
MRRPLLRGLAAIAVATGGVAFTLFTGPAPALAAGAVAGTVSTESGNLIVRADASTNAPKLGLLPKGTRVSIDCQVIGTFVDGRVRDTDRWDRLIDGRFVSDAYIKRVDGVDGALCGTESPDPATGSLVAPPITVPAGTKWILPVGKTSSVGGFRTAARPEHDGVDLPHARFTPIRAASAGTVVTVRCNASTPSCDVDGSTSTTGCGWYVEVRHAADVVTRYCHMVRQPEVTVGQKVAIGDVLGFVGTSGHSSGPHLHFEVHLGYPATRANAVDPVEFMAKVGAPLT